MDRYCTNNFLYQVKGSVGRPHKSGFDTRAHVVCQNTQSQLQCKTSVMPDLHVGLNPGALHFSYGESACRLLFTLHAALAVLNNKQRCTCWSYIKPRRVFITCTSASKKPNKLSAYCQKTRYLHIHKNNRPPYQLFFTSLVASHFVQEWNPLTPDKYTPWSGA